MNILSVYITLIFSFLTANSQQKPYTRAVSHRYEKVINSQWTFYYFPGKNADTGNELS
jgi:hypothetical protein